jgi:hypothetical protein
MQDPQSPHDHEDFDDLSTWTDFDSTGEGATSSVMLQEPYKPPRVPHGLPHVVRFATESGDIPWDVRSMIILLSRYADHKGQASVAVSTLCEIARIGSKNTVERWINLASGVGILRKEPGRGGNDRKSNTYVFLGDERSWEPLPMGKPGINPLIELAQARRQNEELQSRVTELEAALALLRNGGTVTHPSVPNGDEEGPPPSVAQSYTTGDSGGLQENDGAIGHPEVTNWERETPLEEAFHSYETTVSEGPPGSTAAIGHSEVTNGPNEGQEYLARRARVEALVMEQQSYYDRSFRGGVLSAVHHFSLNDENELELLRQISVIRAGQEPGSSGAGAAQEPERPPPREERLTESGRSEVEYCPDCSSPYTTFNGEERCPDCTNLRRRESEA